MVSTWSLAYEQSYHWILVTNIAAGDLLRLSLTSRLPTFTPATDCTRRSHFHHLSSGHLDDRAATGQPDITGTIASSASRPSNTLHHRTTSSQSRPSNTDHSSSLPAQSEKSTQQHHEGHRRTSYASATDSDEFSLWSDTGDIAEQLADEEDPLRIELEPLNNAGQALNGGRKKKRVHYQDQDHSGGGAARPGINKEDIIIPEPSPRRIAKFEKFLAIIMAPNDSQTARSRGLVGKPLL